VKSNFREGRKQVQTYACMLFIGSFCLLSGNRKVTLNSDQQHSLVFFPKVLQVIAFRSHLLLELFMNETLSDMRLCFAATSL